MSIEDVIRDLGTYFGSLGQNPAMKAHMGGAVNPSYFEIEYKGQKQVLPFWSVAGGSAKEKELAAAFKDDITAFIQRVETDRGRQAQEEARRGNQAGNQDKSAQKSPRKSRTWQAGTVSNPNQGDRNPSAEDAA